MQGARTMKSHDILMGRFVTTTKATRQLPGRVAGKIALVTGAGSGIGRATAILLAQQGAAVSCADLDSGQASATALRISGGGHATWVELDVTADEAWSRAVADITSSHGRLDILVNCAGISFACPVVDMSLADWHRVLGVNLDGVFLGTKHAIGIMRERGGSIINVSSASGIKASPGASAYCTSKAAICMFTKAAAKECVEKGYAIRVNTVCPGGVRTPMWTTMPFFRELMAKTGSEERAFEEFARTLPGGRFIESEEVAAAILYLASDESRSVTGTDLVIDNGFTV
jgi:3(or 17)beta-hydroxysteroid dehydrogenase